MQRLVIFFALVAATLALPQPDVEEFPFGRIVNGEATTIEAHPYQVSIQTIGGSHFCGGSLIQTDIVVTAAHCMQRYLASEMQVRLGSTQRSAGGEVISVKSFRFHEKYDSGNTINDVAVIKLSSPVRQTTKVRTVELTKVTPPNGTPAVVTGWGTTCFLFCGSTDTLLEVEVSILDQKTCAQDPFNYAEEKLDETMVCAYGEKKDACQGDSGGPLVAESKLVGIVSWGNMCARAKYPGVYADVAFLRDWILKTAEEL